jgi:ABC-type amino acid transport substrate-binding protein
MLLALTVALPVAMAAPVEDKAPPAVVRIATNIERTYFPPAEALLRKAYAAIGLQVEFVPWPLPRAQVELLAGHADAVAMRTETYFEQSPFVRRVDVPLLTLSVYGYGRPPCPGALSADDLAKARVSYQRGMVAAETLIPEASRLPANTPSDAFLNVSTGAADYALTLTTPWLVELPVDTRQGTLCRIATPLLRTQLYHGVHESHAAWVAPLEQALRTLRERGEIQQAWAEYERQLAAPNTRLQAQPGRSLVVAPASGASRPPP